MPIAAPEPGSTSEIEAELDALHRASEERTAELKQIAAQLPAVVGRRALIRTLVGDARANPNKGEIARRGVRKLGRIVPKAYNEVTYRVRSLRGR